MRYCLLCIGLTSHVSAGDIPQNKFSWSNRFLIKPHSLGGMYSIRPICSPEACVPADDVFPYPYA